MDHLHENAHLCALQHLFKDSTIAQAFMDNIFTLHGMHQSIMIDHDPTFIRNFWQWEFFQFSGNPIEP